MLQRPRTEVPKLPTDCGHLLLSSVLILVTVDYAHIMEARRYGLEDQSDDGACNGNKVPEVTGFWVMAGAYKGSASVVPILPNDAAV
jgi:hypothetical protein